MLVRQIAVVVLKSELVRSAIFITGTRDTAIQLLTVLEAMISTSAMCMDSIFNHGRTPVYTFM